MKIVSVVAVLALALTLVPNGAVVLAGDQPPTPPPVKEFGTRNGHRCYWHKIYSAPEKVSHSQQEVGTDKFALGTADCDKSNVNPQRHEHASCQEHLCYQHRDMPLRAAISQQDIEKSIDKLGGELGLKVKFGIWGNEMEGSLKVAYDHVWESSTSVQSGIEKDIPPIHAAACQECCLCTARSAPMLRLIFALGRSPTIG